MIERSGPDAAQMCLQFGKGHFDGVEIGTVGGQEQEPATLCFEHLRGALTLVRGEVVEDDDRPWLQLWDQDFFDVCVESIPIHGAGDYPRSHDPVAGEARDQGLVTPLPEWSISFDARAAQAAPVLAGHIRIGARLIQKDQAVLLISHGLLAALPVLSCLSNCGLVALFGDQAFFLYV